MERIMRLGNHASPTTVLQTHSRQVLVLHGCFTPGLCQSFHNPGRNSWSQLRMANTSWWLPFLDERFV